MVQNKEPLNTTVYEPSSKTTKERIFEVAVQLFSQRGFSAVSIRDITREVGIKESSLYNHYRSKDELLESVFDYLQAQLSTTRFSDEEIEHMVELLEPAVVFQQFVLRVGQTITPLLDEVWRIVYMEQFRHKRARELYVQEMYTNTIAIYTQIFGVMIEKKKLPPLDPALLAQEFNYAFVCLSLEFNIAKAQGQDPRSIVKQMMDHIQFFMQAVIR